MLFAHNGDALGSAAESITPWVGSAASRGLRAKLSLCWPDNSPPFRPRSLELYIRYLHLMHDVIRASIPLMELALTRCDDQTEQGARLADYYRHHITEESGHVELVLDDLEELGVSNAQALARVPDLTIVAMTGSQYYWLEHVSPLPLLGYIAFLEGRPPTSETLEAVKAILPEGSGAYRALAVHAEADPHHSREMDALLDGLNLTHEQASLIGASAIQSARLSLEAFIAMNANP
jgi:hypothetical protein